MLWLKRKYEVHLRGGVGQVHAEKMFGIVQQMIVIPENEDTIYSIKVLDKDNDVVYERKDHEGRIDDRAELPIGGDMAERPTVLIYDSTSNEKFKIIFKIREAV